MIAHGPFISMILPFKMDNIVIFPSYVKRPEDQHHLWMDGYAFFPTNFDGGHGSYEWFMKGFQPICFTQFSWRVLCQDPMNGLLNPDDYEKGLEEAWERAKPAGSTVTVKDKLAKLSKQNAPHWETWKSLSAWEIEIDCWMGVCFWKKKSLEFCELRLGEWRYEDVQDENVWWYQEFPRF